MNAVKVIFLSFLVSSFSFFFLSSFSKNEGAVIAPKNETVIEAVLKAKKIKCGYLPSPGFLEIDPNTKEKSGLIYDVMTQISKNLGLELEWTEEIGRGDYIAALEARRFDAYCTALAMNSERAKAADFIEPVLYDSFDLYVRADDNRFENDVSKVNQPNVKIVVVEGDISGKVARSSFPNAQLIELPQLSPESDQFLYVASGKADVAISTPKISGQYIDNNPGKIKRVDLGKVFRFTYTSVSIKRGEHEFKRMLDVALMEMHSNGQLDKIIDKYDPERKIFFRRASPY